MGCSGQFSRALLRHLADLGPQRSGEVHHLSVVASYGMGRLQLRRAVLRVRRREMQENFQILLTSPSTDLVKERVGGLIAPWMWQHLILFFTFRIA